MIGTTEKQINHISYWVDYPFENCAARFDAGEGKFYIKFYGEKENEANLDGRLIYDTIRFGDEITKKKYERKSLASA